jgi:hypothetical protein
MLSKSHLASKAPRRRSHFTRENLNAQEYLSNSSNASGVAAGTRDVVRGRAGLAATLDRDGHRPRNAGITPVFLVVIENRHRRSRLNRS